MNIETPEGWRKGQTLFNFLEWLLMHGIPAAGDRVADTFHIPDETLDRLFAQFINGHK